MDAIKKWLDRKLSDEKIQMILAMAFVIISLIFILWIWVKF